MIRLRFAVVLLVCATTAGCTYPSAGSSPTPSRPATEPTATKSPAPKPTGPAKPATGTAKAIAAELRQARVVAVRPDVPGYQRDRFGQAWTDDHNGPGGHNGCDTRNDVLAAQLTVVQNRTAKSCVVVAGLLPSEPYTGRRVEFRKAAASKVQIDHVYPLSRAWDMGAARWSAQRRVDFANDQAANLLAVDGPANASKNDAGPGEWMPLNRAYRCTYVLRYLQVARKYALPITAGDRTAAQAITPTCP
ncbi:deoxyribonuclease [Kribbella sp. ALI-6-A]|uniref:HNH endonuclease family protein n=1 Tax=Kribbella sp. ALI-6-A TaxID=1933817 RepID=UPI00097CA5FB|nr:HNH endonuclease family protein [Kribbella sp. ALI-6-A]ONI73908.1 deoxyribonuclease [Kribbella sp. ALI-6-A]